MNNKLIVSTSPHVHTKESTARIMWLVCLALAPAGIAGVYIFGVSALRAVLIAVVSAVCTELAIQAALKKKATISDGSAVLTGLLLGYNLPAHCPFWIPAVGAFVAIAIGKQIFGGLGQNIFNPALVGRAFLTASWPQHMTRFTAPLSFDAVTQATPLALLKENKLIDHISYLDLFLGNKGGCIGEVCAAALLIGGIFLLARGIISWHIPLTFIATTGCMYFIFGGKVLFTGEWLFAVLSGGLFLGAIFMATDYVTSPLTRKGQVIFGAGCGLLTAVIRLWGGTPEGVSYSILMMNAAAPLIDRYTKKRIFGTK
ncbi:MAG: RnfABCDGE type electron transport complex subunit D [Candidatus Omnitrophica bacterium]|nr:RnfABCDGE type electron transport complex subunit D [Candidatus Omnitrophota bacterium]